MSTCNRESGEIKMGSKKPKVFTIELSSNTNGHNVFYPGSKVKGTVILELSEALRPLQGIEIVLTGQAHTEWTKIEVVGQHSYNFKYTNTEKIMDELVEKLWVANPTEGVYQQKDGFAAGRHEFPFKFHLPKSHNLPSSFESTDPSGPAGFIRYMLTARISQSSIWNYEHVTVKAVSVCGNIDVNTPNLVKPLSRSKDKTSGSLFCASKSGYVSLTVTTDRGAYCAGESIAVSVTVESYGRKKAQVVQASLKQTVTYHGTPTYDEQVVHHLPPKSSSFSKVIKKIDGCADWHNKLLPVPATVPTIVNCRAIEVSYTLEVSLLQHHALHVEIPIVIGTVPFKGSSDIIHDALLNDCSYKEKLGYTSIDKPVYIGKNAFTMGDLHYAPLYCFVSDYQFAPADSEPATVEIDTEDI